MKKFYLQTKQAYFKSQNDLVENVSYEQEKIQGIIRMYTQRFENNQKELDKLQNNLNIMGHDIKNLDEELRTIITKAQENEKKFHDYTESHLKVKNHIMYFIRELHNKRYDLNSTRSNIEAFKTFQELKELNNSLEEIKTCKICYKEMTKVYVDSNSHVICESCLSKISRCPYCAKDITDFNRNRVLEDLISRTLTTKNTTDS